MKFAVVLLAVVGVTCAASVDSNPKTASRSLLDDWIELVTLIPRGPIINILVRYLATDAEVQGMIMHLVSPEVKANIAELDQEIDFLNFIEYLEAHQLQGTYDFLNAINSFFGWGVIYPPTRDIAAPRGKPMFTFNKLDFNVTDVIEFVQLGEAMSGETRGWLSMWREIGAIWPSDEVKAFHADKLVTSEDYILLFKDLGADECRDLAFKVAVLPSWQRGVMDFRRAGINVDMMTKYIVNLFKWDISAASRPVYASYALYSILFSILGLLYY